MTSTTRKIIYKAFRLIDFRVYDDTSESMEHGVIDEVSASGSDSERSEGNKKEYPKKQFIIQMFGVNEKGETCCIYVDDYHPFFYVKVADNWTQAQATSLRREMVQRIGHYHDEAIVSVEIVKHHKLYGFSGGKKHTFVKITCRNTITLNRLRSLWYISLGVGLGRKLHPFVFNHCRTEIYEATIPPLLRYFHIQDISPSGWINVPSHRLRPVSKHTTTCHHEYICHVQQLKSLPEKETRVPYKICSFDIEASSSHGDFPLPVKTYKRLATNMVDVFVQYAGHGRSEMLLQRVVLTAFGFDIFNDVDRVYPKVAPTEAVVRRKIDVLLKTPLDDVRKMTESNGDLTIDQLLAIDSTFDQLQKHMGQAGEGDGEGDGGDSDAEEHDDPETSDEPVAAPPKHAYRKMAAAAAQKRVSVDKKSTLLDILTSTQYDRDEKIQLVNDTMIRVGFPPLEGDKVTFIGSTFMRYGENEPYMNHCLVLDSCDPVDGVVIETADTEKDLLLKWTDLIQRENPDIMIGYNIFGFDYEFLFRRAQETHCERDFLQFSRRIGDLSAKEVPPPPDVPNARPTLAIEHTTVQLASGEYDLRYFQMTGRLQVDMYTYFRRDFNLSSYKLDDVAGQYISDQISKSEWWTDVDTGKQTTALYTSNVTGLHVGDFIRIELSGFTSDYHKNGHKFRVVDMVLGREVEEIVKGVAKRVTYNIVVIDGHEDLGDAKNLRWGMSKDDVTPQDIFRLSKEGAAGRAIVAKYCIQDCNLVHHLMNKIDVMTGYVEMSRICSVPISFLVFRGQGIKLTSYVAKKCREKDTLMPDLDKSGENDGYEGAIVLPPKCSMYMDNPVACVDYASLYPSSMISQNYSHDSKVWTKEYNLEGKLLSCVGEQTRDGTFVYDNLPGYEYIDIEFDTFKYMRKTPTSRAEKVKCGKKVCRWAQFPDNRKGIMPSILEELLKARAVTRKMAKTEKDPFMQNILDKRQLGYKVTANSLYGQCGAKTSTFYEKDVAASTTATGRMMITYAKRMIEEVYGNFVYDTVCHGPVKTRAEYVYGDTDSVFFTFNLQDVNTGEPIRGEKALEITIEIAQDVAHLCTQFLKPPMELTYEKTLMPFVLLSKKRYVGMLYETDPKKGKLKYMGLSLKRRDSCDYLKDTYGGILNILMKENDISRAIGFLDNSIRQLIQGNVPMDKLMITKALRSDYANPQQIAHRVLADRIGKRDPGNKPKPGDRIKFVFVVNHDKKALQGEKIETPDYIVANRLAVDYTHYITNQLMKPLQQLFGLAVEQIWTNMNKPLAIRDFRKELAVAEKDFSGNFELFMKKKEKLCAQKVKTLLFDKFLTQIQNERNRLQPITSFFGKR
jgi:DNA polymerase elongation subunit (family B)